MATRTFFPIYDGNGNVTNVYGLGTGASMGTNVQQVASYEYGPFGEVRSITGVQGLRNPFRWSTKYTDAETGLVYYGYRYYSASLGRWISRDPIGEEDGPNVYSYVRNIPSHFVDPLGDAGFTGFEDCTDVQKSAIVQAERLVIRRSGELAKKLPQFSIQPNRNDLTSTKRPQSWSNKSVTSADRDTYNAYIRGLLQRIESVQFGLTTKNVVAKCVCGKDAPTEDAITFTGIIYRDRIEFYPSFFAKAPQRRAQVLLHETTHYFSETDDLVENYFTIKPQKGGKPNSSYLDSRNDAYFYEHFVGSSVESVLDSYVWSRAFP